MVIEMATAKQVFATPDEENHRGFRAMAVDSQGRVMFSRPRRRAGTVGSGDAGDFGA